MTHQLQILIKFKLTNILKKKKKKKKGWSMMLDCNDINDCRSTFLRGERAVS